MTATTGLIIHNIPGTGRTDPATYKSLAEKRASLLSLQEKINSLMRQWYNHVEAWKQNPAQQETNQQTIRQFKQGGVKAYNLINHLIPHGLERIDGCEMGLFYREMGMLIPEWAIIERIKQIDSIIQSIQQSNAELEKLYETCVHTSPG